MGQQLEHGLMIMDQMEHWWKHNKNNNGDQKMEQQLENEQTKM